MKKSPSIEILKKSKVIISIRILACILTRSLYLVLPLIFGSSINHISNGYYVNAVILVGIGLIVALSAKASLIFMNYMWNRLYERLTIEYTKLSFNRLDKNNIADHGKILNILNNDIDIMSHFFPSLIRRIIRTLEIIVIFVYFFTIGYYFGFASISASAFCLVIINISNKKVAQANKIMMSSYDNRSNFISKILSSDKSPNKESKLNSLTKDYTKKIRIANITEETLRSSVLAIVEFFRWGMIGMAIYLYTKGNIEIGTIVIIYTYFSALVLSFEEFSSISISFEQFKVSEKRFNKLLDSN